jgi:hypothetical protein
MLFCLINQMLRISFERCFTTSLTKEALSNMQYCPKSETLEAIKIVIGQKQA